MDLSTIPINVSAIQNYLNAIKETKPPSSIRWRISAIENRLNAIIAATGAPSMPEISYSEDSEDE